MTAWTQRSKRLKTEKMPLPLTIRKSLLFFEKILIEEITDTAQKVSFFPSTIQTQDRPA